MVRGRLAPFHFSAAGASHIKSGTVCQDASLSEATDSYALAVVSDGHGGEDYFRSDRGSAFAVTAFSQCVREAFSSSERGFSRFFKRKRDLSDGLVSSRTEREREELMRRFMGSVVARWNALVESDAEKDPFSEEELKGVSERAREYYERGEKLHSAYGATLVGAVVCDGFWFGVQIGDGRCVAFDGEGRSSEPIPWDERCFLNVTTSLCDSRACSEMRYFFSYEVPIAVFVGSDGIDGSFDHDIHLHNFYRLVLSSFSDRELEAATEELRDYLPTLSKSGSADDVSVACLIDTEYARESPSLHKAKRLIKIRTAPRRKKRRELDLYEQ